jgi:copper transport protein
MRRFFLLCLAIIGTLASFAGTAHAAGDNTIASSNPAAGEVVMLAPTQIQLRFTLPVGGEEAIAQMGLVLTCENKITNLGPPQLAPDGVTVSAALTQIPENGRCTVTWSLPDGSTGSFGFTSQAQATTTIPATEPGSTATTIPGVAPEDVIENEPRLGGPIGLMRWISFMLVAAFFGGLIFLKMVWPEGVEYGITEKYFRQLSILAAISLVLLIMLTTARQSGEGFGAAVSPTGWGPLFETNEGRALFFRLIAVIGLGFYAWVTARIFEPTNIVPTTALLLVLMMSYGFDRASGRMVILGIAIAIAHMALISIWVGSVAIIWRVVLHGPGDIDLVHALRGWYKYATPVSLGIIVTGVIQVWRIDNISLINSGHGRVVILKTLVVLAMFFVSATVRQFVLRGMQRAKSLNERVVYRLKRPIGTEVALSVVVLALSSWLLAMRPPYVLLADKGPSVQYAIVQDMKGDDNFRVRLSITPGNVGSNRILIELFGPSRIQNFTVKLTPTNPNFSGYTINVPITRPGGALVGEDANMLLRAPGQWDAVVTGVTTTGDLPTLTASFIIADGTTVTTQPKQGLTTIPSTTTVPPATTTTVAAETTTTPPPVAPAPPG